MPPAASVALSARRWRTPERTFCSISATRGSLGGAVGSRKASEGNDTLFPVWQRKPEKPGVLDALHAVLRLGSPRRLRRTWRWVREIAGQIRRRRAEPRLTVAVDVNSFYEPLTGVGWYLHQILQHLAGRDDVRLRLYGQRLVHGDPWIRGRSRPSRPAPPSSGSTTTRRTDW